MACDAGPSQRPRTEPASSTAKTVRNLKWIRVTELEGSIKDQKVVEYHATVKIYFDLES